MPPQMRRVEFPKIALTAAKMEDGNVVLDDTNCPARPHGPGDTPPSCRCRPIREPVRAQDLHALALAKAGGAAGYEGLLKHLPISAALETASKADFMLLDEEAWKTLTAALVAYRPWPWYHADVLRVIHAAKEAEKVDVDVKGQKGPNRASRRRAKKAAQG